MTSREELNAIKARARDAFGFQSTPGTAVECPGCEGQGFILVAVGPRDEFGLQHVEEVPCPACSRVSDRSAT